MAGSALTSFHCCTAALRDPSSLQLQLLRTPEQTAAVVAPRLRARRKNRPRISIPAKPSLDLCIHSRVRLPPQILPHGKMHLQMHALAYVDCTPLPLPDSCEGWPLMHETSRYPWRKNSPKISIVCATAKPMLDRCSNDADDAIASTEELSWREEVLAALQRSLLESQWALQSARSLFIKEAKLKLESSKCSHPQQSAKAAVSSGRVSARQRRLCSHLRSRPQNRGDSLRASGGFVIPAKLQGKTKKGKFKVDPLQDFISSFLRPTNGCGMLTKEQEQGFTRHMKICQSLEKAKRELKERFGYDPSHEVWARSVNLSTDELSSMINKGEFARNKMLYSHLRLVVAVAKHYQNLGVDINDLIQEGSKGLLHGLEKFDHRKGCKLSTYVHWWIRQGMTRAIADHSRLVRVPVYLHEIMFAIRRAKASLAHQGKPVTVENLSLLLKVPSYKIERALQAKNRVTSLDKTDNSYGLKMDFNGLHEFVADQNRENQPWDSLIEEDMRDNVRNRMTVLTLKEQKIIRWTFGIDTEGGVQSSLTAVGKKLGISKERVRQLKARALSKMRRWGGDDST